jgi:hypothetical protein
MGADWAIGRTGASWLLASGSALGTVFYPFGAGIAVGAVRKRTRAVGGVRTDLSATAVAETSLTGGAGAGDGLAAGAGVVHRVAATGAGRVDVALESTDVLG